MSVGNKANRLAALRKFFSWLLSEQQIAYNPAPTFAAVELKANVQTFRHLVFAILCVNE